MKINIFHQNFWWNLLNWLKVKDKLPLLIKGISGSNKSIDTECLTDKLKKQYYTYTLVFIRNEDLDKYLDVIALNKSSSVNKNIIEVSSIFVLETINMNELVIFDPVIKNYLIINKNDMNFYNPLLLQKILSHSDKTKINMENVTKVLKNYDEHEKFTNELILNDQRMFIIKTAILNTAISIKAK